MKTKFIRFISLILVLAICLSLVACNKNDSDTPDTPDTPATGDKLPNNTTATETIPGKTEHFVEGTLHKVNVTPTNRVFFANEQTEYKIVYGNGAYDKDAVTIIVSNLSAASQGAIEAVKYTSEMTWSTDSKYIVFNVPQWFTQAGLTMPQEKLGPSGYYIKNAGESVFIAFEQDIAAKQAAVRFLKYCIGYEMYADDTVVYENSAETLPDFDVIERPDYDYGSLGSYASQKAIDGMGMNTTGDIFIPIEGYQWHNSLHLLPKSEFQKDHEEWYTLSGTELCYTARGNADELELMTTTAAQRMFDIASKPEYANGKVICFSIMDHIDSCACQACADSRAQYNGLDSAAVIKFMNITNRKLQALFQQDADEKGAAKREVGLLILAYHKTEVPPAVQKNGKWEAMDDSVKCDPEVGVMIAPINAAYNKTFYEEENNTFANGIAGWGALCNNVFMWLYEANFGCYMYPYNTYDTMLETFRFCKAQGATFILPEGPWNNGNSTAFYKLKDYFNSRARFNVNDSYTDICNDWFANYFRDAATPMRQYFDELQAHLYYLEDNYLEINGGIYNPIDVTTYWPYATLAHWMDLIDQAYDAIEKYQTEDPALYDILRKHIMLESIFPRFALCNLHGGMYTSSELVAMRKAFRTDCMTLNVTHYNEGKPLDEIYTSWGI